MQMRKLLTFLAALVAGTTALFAQLTPYEYGHRWYIAVQGGAVYFNSDYSYLLKNRGMILDQFSLVGSAALGYNINDGHEIRLMGSYSKKTSVCEPFIDEAIEYDVNEEPPIYPYTFRSVLVYIDHVLNYNGLAEYNIAFNPKTYFGLGAAYTFDFSDPGHPEVWLYERNLVPAVHFGAILEYDFPSGFGLYADLGVALFWDRYNGFDRVGFPMDLEVGPRVGMIYHFQRPKKARH